MCFRKTIKNYERNFQFISFELFVHYKGFFLVNHRQSPRQGVKMTEENCVGCESNTKYVCLKYDAFACTRSLKCSGPAFESYPGWVALCFKCDKEEHPTDYQQQDSSEEKENEEVTGTSDDVELVIHCTSKGLHKYQKIWSSKFGQKLNIKRDKKISLFDPYAMGHYCEIIFLEKYPDFVNIS